jgi:hypothetical protein
MFRSMSRTAVVSAVVLTLVLSFVPAAQASPFGSGPSLDTRSGWFDLALSWLSGLVFGEETSSPQPAGSAFEASNTNTSPIGDFATPLSGGCMDPEGRPRPTCY